MEYKLKFYSALELRCRELLEEGHQIIVLGDLNVAHQLIDHCEPEDPANFSKAPSRVWLGDFLAGRKFVDAFRHLYPTKEKSFTCWNTKVSARANNYGTRIDYVLLSAGLVPHLIDCVIMAEVHGSDHCPVKALLNVEITASSRLPGLCTRFFREFAGKQLKMSNFLCKRPLPASCAVTTSVNKKPKIVVKQSNLLNFFSRPKASEQNLESQQIQDFELPPG